MHVETTTWSPAEGWHDALPVPDGRSSLVLVVGDPEMATLAADPLGDIWARWSGHAVVGCSTRSHATNTDLDEGALLDGGLSVAVLRFERTDVRCRHHEMVRAGGARRACRRLASDLADPALQGILVFGDGLRANASSMLLGFTDILPETAVFGATASDGERYGETWTVVDGRPVSGWVSAVGLFGDAVDVGHGVGSGWEPRGTDHLVTSSFGDVVYSIDDEPPLELHRRSPREGSDELYRRSLGRPWLVRDLEDRALPRAVIRHDARTDAVRCGADVMQGASVQMLDATAESLVEATHQAAKQAAHGREQFALVCSGTGRTSALGDRAVDEVDGALHELEPGCRVLGMQSLAEISPDEVRNACVSVTTISEAR